MLVALYLERSLELIVGLLGILKAGGAYVPLDPSSPPERLAFMLADTQAQVFLTQQPLLPALPSHSGPVLCLERDWETIRHESAANLPGQTTAEHLAYVIYTSGSTGQPKGVAVPHRGIVRLVCGAAYVPFDSTQVFLQLAPMSFDAATFELWGALLHGATCVLYPDRMPTPHTLGAILTKHPVSILWLTASLFNTLLDQAPQLLTGVRYVLTGGEALSVAHMRRALTLLPQTQLLNGYGPTESTTFACTYALPPQLAATAPSIPIGRPIANTELYLLDAQLTPVPIGVVGELYIGGAGLARGYLQRPELTAEKFLPHPFSPVPGARLYKTGDLARYLPDGNMEFLGRSDTQVKLRGYRIELGEIETVLSQHPAVREAVVVVHEAPPGDKRLVAYLTGADPALSQPAVHAFLTTKLPAYMLPSAVVCLPRLPLTPNGKVDRHALALQAPHGTEGTATYVAPRTPREQLLADIWRALLNRERIGIHDNFFDLGGHSLLATRVVWALEKHLGRAVPVASLFHAPTIEQLARLVGPAEPLAPDALEGRLIKLWEAEFATGPLLASSNFFELGGDWLRALRLLLRVEIEFGKRLPLAALFEAPTLGQMVNQLRQPGGNDSASRLLPYRTTGSQPPFFGLAVPRELMHYLSPDQPVYGFPPYGFDGRRGPGTVEEIATHYLREIRSIQAEGPYWIGGYSLEGMIAFEMAQQLQRQGQPVAGLFLFDPPPPYSGTRAQSVRSTLSSHRPSLRSIGSSLSHRLRQLKALPPRERPLRLWTSVHGRFKNRINPITIALKLLLCRGYLTAGYMIPPDLREFYGYYSRYPIARRYRPKPYAGPVVLFKSVERSVPTQTDWEPLLTGDAAIYQIQIPVRHGAIFKPPYFQSWGAQIEEAFHQLSRRRDKENSPIQEHR